MVAHASRTVLFFRTDHSVAAEPGNVNDGIALIVTGIIPLRTAAVVLQHIPFPTTASAPEPSK